MPVTSTRQSVWNEGAARGLISLIAFGPSVIKVAHPWYTTVCETDSLINAYDLHGGVRGCLATALKQAHETCINVRIENQANIWPTY